MDGGGPGKPAVRASKIRNTTSPPVYSQQKPVPAKAVLKKPPPNITRVLPGETQQGNVTIKTIPKNSAQSQKSQYQSGPVKSRPLKFEKNQDISYGTLQHEVAKLVDTLSVLLLHSIDPKESQDHLTEHVMEFQNCVKNVLEIARGIALQKKKDEPLVVPHISTAIKVIGEAVKGFIHVFPGYIEHKKTRKCRRMARVVRCCCKRVGKFS